MSRFTPSPALLAANSRLLALRQQQQPKTGVDRLPWHDSVPPATAVESVPALAKLPSHLGWHSDAVTAVLRPPTPPVAYPHALPVTSEVGLGTVDIDKSWRPTSEVNAPTPPPSTPYPTHLKLYPSLGLAMLRQEQTTTGRLWLLLRHLDQQGSGRLPLTPTRKIVTAKDSPHRLCGPRQWRHLLRAGEGIFWQRENGYIWLRSTAKVAYALDLLQLTGSPIELPFSALLAGIGTFRAHLYAAFHSGRNPAEAPHGSPIARDTLTSLTAVRPSSQRNYEATLKLQAQTNIAIGERESPEAREERHWQQGNACFTFIDHHGQQGPAGQHYLAWQLPNSYQALHQRRPKGMQKRLNRQLKDLVMQGIPGNMTTMIEPDLPAPRRRYYANGRLASQARQELPIYWPEPTQTTGANRWHLL